MRTMFLAVCFLGHPQYDAGSSMFAVATQETDFYLVSGTCASPIGYGNRHRGRAGLPPTTPCP